MKQNKTGRRSAGGRGLAKRALSLAVAGLLAMSPVVAAEEAEGAETATVVAESLGIYGGGGGMGGSGFGGGAGYLMLQTGGTETWQYGTPGTGGGHNGTQNDAGYVAEDGTGKGGASRANAPLPEVGVSSVSISGATTGHDSDKATGNQSGGKALYDLTATLTLTGNLDLYGGNGGAGYVDMTDPKPGSPGGAAELTVTTLIANGVGPQTFTFSAGEEGTDETVEGNTAPGGAGGAVTAKIDTLRLESPVTAKLENGVTWNGTEPTNNVSVGAVDIAGGSLAIALTDPDATANMGGKTLSYTSGDGPVLTVTGGTFSGAATVSSAVKGEITWTATDASGGTTTATINTITDPNATNRLDLTNATSVSVSAGLGEITVGGEGTAYPATKEGLQKAVDDVAEGGTVTLAADVNVGAGGVVSVTGKSVTLDLNGHTISGKNPLCVGDSYAAAALTIGDSSSGKAGKVEATDIAVNVLANCALTVKGGTISASGENNPAIRGAYQNCNITIAGGAILAPSQYGITGGSKVIVSGGTILSYYGILLTNNGTDPATVGVITGGSIRGVYVTPDAVAPTNGSANGNKEVKQYTLSGLPANTAVADLQLTPALDYNYGMTDVKTDAAGKLYLWLPDTLDGTRLSLTADGKTYAGTLDDYAATLRPTAPLIQVGGEGTAYPADKTGLQAAMDNVTEGGTVKLAAKVALGDDMVSVNKTSVFLDLNGHTISGSNPLAVGSNNSQPKALTIGDSSSGKTGKVEATSSAVIVYANCSLTVEGGTLSSSGGSAPAIYDVQQSGDITIAGGAIVSAQYGIRGRGTVTVSGGTILATDRGILLDDPAVVGVITGGSIRDVSVHPDAAAPTNGKGEMVKQYTLSGLSADAAVTALTMTPAYTYGIRDMKADSTGKLYLWLPDTQATAQVSLTAGGTTYTGTIASGAAAMTVYTPPSGDDSGGGTTTPPAVTTPEPPKTEGGSTTVTTPVKPDVKGDTATGAVTEKAVTDAIASAEQEAAKTGAAPQVEIKVDAPKDAKNVTLAVPKASISAVATGKTENLVITSPVASLSFDSKSLAAIAGAAVGEVQFSAAIVDNSKLTQEQKDKAGDRPVFDFTVTSGGKTISDFGGGTVEVSAPYALPDGENPEGLVVYYLADDGTLKEVPATYDAKTGTVNITLSHFSKYVVAYDATRIWNNPFTDVARGAWYYDAVRYVNQNGLMSGTGETTFAPETTTSRGMVVTILYRLAGNPAVTGTSFPDVAQGSYCSDAVLWATQNKIVGGYADGSFGPNNPITREQLATILMNYAKYKGADVTARADLSKFTDSAAVSSYAKQAMAWANACGILNGKSDNLLAPGGQATRAETATMLMQFSSLVLG